jgi:hypothetical protein
MSSLSATQSDGYYLPPEYFESGAYKKVSRNRFAAETEASGRDKSGKKLKQKQKPSRVGHNQWLKHGVVRFELPEKASAQTDFGRHACRACAVRRCAVLCCATDPKKATNDD